jgi:hypothetical protein
MDRSAKPVGEFLSGCQPAHVKLIETRGVGWRKRSLSEAGFLKCRKNARA